MLQAGSTLWESKGAIKKLDAKILLPLRFELRILDSKSRVITTSLQETFFYTVPIRNLTL